jgi:HEAT repeat protein
MPELEKALGDSDAHVRLAAAWALAALGNTTKRKDIVGILTASLATADERSREKSRQILLNMGEREAVERFRAAEAKQLDDATAAEAKEGDTAGTSRKRAVVVDVSLAQRAAEKAARRHSRRVVERQDLQQLSKWQEQLPYLAVKLQQGNVSEQLTAVRVLRNMCSSMEEAVSMLSRGLSSQAPEVRSLTALALGELRVEEAVGQLIQVLDDPDARAAAVVALEKIGTAQALAAIGPVKGEIPEARLSRLRQEQVGLPERRQMPASHARALCRDVLAEKDLKGEVLAATIEVCVREMDISF